MELRTVNSACMSGAGARLLLSGSDGEVCLARWLSGTNLSPERWSTMTAWRCEKVPRSTSWPLSRTWLPSSSSVPKASASAVAQSRPSPLWMVSRRACTIFTSCLCACSDSGSLHILVPTSFSRSTATPVSRMRDSCLGDRKPLHLELSQSCLGVSHVLAAWNSASSVRLTMPRMSSSASWLQVPSATSCAPYTASVSGCLLIFSYRRGCVYMGWSSSLWP
mmetsp:Transcript_12259/g.16811  ORF Transcript_12259/g.16811 Transcript_12259/m.16811 type:complete len:221 (-) Transcript_12259:1626-2288(-)